MILLRGRRNASKGSLAKWDRICIDDVTHCESLVLSLVVVSGLCHPH